MGKRQLRISHPDLVRQRIGEFVNKRIQLVLRDNTVFFGELRQVNGDNVLLNNMRLKPMKFTFDMIQEFYVDIDA